MLPLVQIESQAYERQVLQDKQNNFDSALSEHLAEQADKTMKNIYMLDTLGLAQPVLEAQLEKAMVDKIQDVMQTYLMIWLKKNGKTHQLE